MGASVEHSQSPSIHNAWLRANERPERFGAVNVPDSRGALRLLTTAAGRIGLHGISITNPHKENAVSCCEPDEWARKTGAVNCMRLGERNEGTNTDVTALLRLLKGAGETAMVLGAGGAARAAIVACKELGMDVQVSCRNPERGAAVAELGATFVPWEARGKDVDVLIQATPADDITYDGAFTTLLEMVYKSETALAATHTGSVITGTQLLEEQARDAYAYWFGASP
ncbi:MAG: shikimate dehydrogenase family protein [Thermoplasmatota archaeon]